MRIKGSQSSLVLVFGGLFLVLVLVLVLVMLPLLGLLVVCVWELCSFL